MTDTNTTPTNTPAVNPTRDFINTLIDQFSIHIEGIVERKVNDIMQSHATMALIDEKTEDRIAELIEDRIRVHEGDCDHVDRDEVSDTVATHIAHTDFSDTIRRSVEEILSDGDYATEERVEDLVQEHISDIDVEEKVKEVLRNI